MVTCQSANQLKTPANVSWVFKMVSQFGSLGYTIMGKTADLTVVQKTTIDTLHKESKTQTLIAKEAGCSQSAVSKHVNRKLSGRKTCGRKRCTTNRENRSLMRIIKQNRFKNLGEYTQVVWKPEFHNLSWITEINELFHKILIYWDAPVFERFYAASFTYFTYFWKSSVQFNVCRHICKHGGFLLSWGGLSSRHLCFQVEP